MHVAASCESFGLGDFKQPARVAFGSVNRKETGITITFSFT